MNELLLKLSNTLEDTSNAIKSLLTNGGAAFLNKSPITDKIAAASNDIEQLQPEYLNPKFEQSIHIPKMYRFNQSGLRYYFTVSDSQDVIFYPSVTTIIEKTTEMSYGLKQIMAEKGMDGYYAFMKERALYGTLLHVLIADYLRNNKNFDTDTIPGRVAEYIAENNIRFNTDNWSFSLNKDLRSLVQFVNDYDVTPIAIELIGFYGDGNYRFAGAIDLLCEMTIKEKGFYGEVYKSGENKGQPKETYQERRVLAVVDFKSGKNGFHTDHEIQLNMYKIMAEHSCKVTPEKLFNVSPKDWDKTPSYNIKDQSDSLQKKRIPALLESFSVIWQEPKEILIMSGKLNGGNMQDCTKWVSASEWVLGKLGLQKNPPVKGELKGVPEPSDELHVIAEKIKTNPVKPTITDIKHTVTNDAAKKLLESIEEQL